MVNLGDLLEVHDEGTVRYCEVVGKKTDEDERRFYEVYYVHLCDDGYYRHDEEFSILYDSSAIRYRVRNRANYEVAWSQMGFLCVGTETPKAMLYCDNPSYHVKTTIISDSSDEDTDASETSESESDGSIGDFIVDTSDMETEEESEETDEYVRAVAEADRAFESWEPQSPGERRFKETIDRLETRAKHRRADRRM